MSAKSVLGTLTFSCVVSVLATCANAQSSPVIQGASGHWYQIERPVNGVTQAQAIGLAAQHSYYGHPGVLSSWQSINEAQDVVGLFNSRGISMRNLWLNGRFYDHGTYGDIWYWPIDGTILNYRFWAPGEPNGPASEIAICTWTDSGLFNNLSPNGTKGNNGPMGYLVEYR